MNPKQINRDQQRAVWIKVVTFYHKRMARRSVLTTRQSMINWPLSTIFTWQLRHVLMVFAAVERWLLQILYNVFFFFFFFFFRPGNIGLLCAWNDYDFYRLYFSLSKGHFQEALEDLHRVEEITGKSKFLWTVCLCLYVLIVSQIFVFSLTNKEA